MGFFKRKRAGFFKLSFLGSFLVSSLVGLFEFYTQSIRGGVNWGHIFFLFALVFSATFLTSFWRLNVFLQRHKRYLQDLENMNAKLKELAITDGLTETHNHRYFEIKLEHEWQKMLRLRHALSCVIMDIDNFKNINDRYGHKAGDIVLQGISVLLQKEFREIDIISRYGGEEFAIILVEKPGSREGLYRTIERIRKRVAQEKFNFENNEVQVTASFGGAMVPNAKIGSPNALVIAADRAMYRAKRAGKNCSRVFGR